MFDDVWLKVFPKFASPLNFVITFKPSLGDNSDLRMFGNIFVVMWVRDACAGDVRFGKFLVGGVKHPY